MGLFDDLSKAVSAASAASPASDGTQSSMVSAALSMLSTEHGGLPGLIQRFTSSGLGDVVSSWVGTGQNLPVAPAQIQTALGAEQVRTIATKLGISPEAASAGLAHVLPSLVDRLTPNGEVPQGDLMSKGMELLKGKLFA